MSLYENYFKKGMLIYFVSGNNEKRDREKRELLLLFKTFVEMTSGM
jgi:hypothetical protein